MLDRTACLKFFFRWKFRAKPKGPMYILQLFLVTSIYINVYNFGLISCFSDKSFFSIFHVPDKGLVIRILILPIL